MSDIQFYLTEISAWKKDPRRLLHFSPKIQDIKLNWMWRILIVIRWLTAYVQARASSMFFHLKSVHTLGHKEAVLCGVFPQTHFRVGRAAEKSGSHFARTSSKHKLFRVCRRLSALFRTKSTVWKCSSSATVYTQDIAKPI